jgi:hypothetical protein
MLPRQPKHYLYGILLIVGLACLVNWAIMRAILPASAARVFVNETGDSPAIKPPAAQINEQANEQTNEPSGDFALVLEQDKLDVSQGEKGQFRVKINRSRGFTGDVVVIAPDTRSLKIKITPSMQSTAGSSAGFDFKIKRRAAVGTQQLTFTGRDDTGRIRTSSITLTVKE